MAFVPFQPARLLCDDGRPLQGAIEACAKAVATLGAVRTTAYVIKGREVVRKDGQRRFQPMFRDRDADVLHMPSIHCASCGQLMPKVGLLCTPCKGLPVRLRSGPPLVDFAWEGSHESIAIGQAEAEAVSDADSIFHFAVDGVRFGKMLVYLSELAAVGKTESDAGMEYPNVSLPRLNLNKDMHFVYSIVLDESSNEVFKSASKLLFVRVLQQALQWISSVDRMLADAQDGECSWPLCEDDRRRLDRTMQELAHLIANHVAMQVDESKRDRLTPACLEKKALCEFLRCSSKAMDEVEMHAELMRRLLEAIPHFPPCTRMGDLPYELVGFVFDSCPPELVASLPSAVDVSTIECSVFATVLMQALQRLQEWQPPSETAVRFSSSVVLRSRAVANARTLPPMPWYHAEGLWLVKQWPRSNRCGLDVGGVRIVRLISAVWGMHASGAFEAGVVHSSVLSAVGQAYAARAAAVRELAVQVLQPTLLRANLVNAKKLIVDCIPEIEDEIEDCTSAFANFALDEVMTITSQQSPLYRENYWKIAEQAASMMTVELPSAFYRDFVRVILPLAVGHLAERRQRRGMPITMRSNWIAEALFREPAVVEIATLFLKGEPLPPLLFVPYHTLRTRVGRDMMTWLSDQDRRFVRFTRIGDGRVRGFELVVHDLVQVLYPAQ
jgi:hypothetical protein